MDLRGIAISWTLFLSSARIQKKRAILTVAAIAWGTVSLLLLLSFGEGLKRQLSRGSAGMGSGIAVIWPGETTKTWQGMAPGRPIRPVLEDVPLIRERVRDLDAAVGEMHRWGTSVVYGRKTINVHVIGTGAVYGDLRNYIPLQGGRFINDQDEQERRRVIFLGNAVAKSIFGDEDPVGKNLLVMGAPYTVVGVLVKKMQMGTYGGPDEDSAVIPITTFKAQFGREALNNLVVRPTEPALMGSCLESLREVLAAKYAFDPTDEPVLGVWDTVESGAVLRNVLIGIQMFLGIIGGLTLLIGGVGVANIMYATVKERTREIGVKMALGARPRWVTGPFILEGLLYTVIGGMLGLCIAVGLIILLRQLPTEGNEALEFLGKPTLSPAVGVVSAAVLGIIGLLSAYFPARRAAAVDPAQTLRYE